MSSWALHTCQYPSLWPFSLCPITPGQGGVCHAGYHNSKVYVNQWSKSLKRRLSRQPWPRLNPWIQVRQGDHSTQRNIINTNTVVTKTNNSQLSMCSLWMKNKLDNLSIQLQFHKYIYPAPYVSCMYPSIYPHIHHPATRPPTQPCTHLHTGSRNTLSAPPFPAWLGSSLNLSLRLIACCRHWVCGALGRAGARRWRALAAWGSLSQPHRTPGVVAMTTSKLAAVGMERQQTVKQCKLYD